MDGFTLKGTRFCVAEQSIMEADASILSNHFQVNVEPCPKPSEILVLFTG